MAQTNPNQALHFSEGKPGVDQIPPEVLLELGKVYTFGETKYARDNWLKGNDWHEFQGSLLRHSLAWWAGEDIDPESGIYHLAHLIWCGVALLHFQMKGIGTDDRPISTPLPPDPDTGDGLLAADDWRDKYNLPLEWGGIAGVLDHAYRNRH